MADPIVFSNTGISFTKYNDYFLAGLPIIDFTYSTQIPFPIKNGAGFFTHSYSYQSMNKTIIKALSLQKTELIKMGKIGYMAELNPENSYELLPKYLDNQLIDQNMNRI